MLGFSRKQGFGQQSAEEDDFGQRHFHFPRAGAEFPSHLRVGSERTQIVKLHQHHAPASALMFLTTNGVFLGVVGAAIKSFAACAVEAATEFVLAKGVEEVELHQDADKLGRAARSVEHEGFARGSIASQTPIVVGGQDAKAALHPRLENRARLPVAVRSPGAQQMHIAVNGFQFPAGRPGFVVEAEFDADVFMKKAAPFLGIGDFFQSAEERAVGGPRTVNFNRERVGLKFLGADYPG